MPPDLKMFSTEKAILCLSCLHVCRKIDEERLYRYHLKSFQAIDHDLRRRKPVSNKSRWKKNVVLSRTYSNLSQKARHNSNVCFEELIKYDHVSFLAKKDIVRKILNDFSDHH